MQIVKALQREGLLVVDIKKDWDAKWIWDAFHQYTANCYACFRKTVTLENADDIDEVKVYCTGSTEYKLHINGRYIGRGSIPSQVEYQYYEEYSFNRYEAGKLFGNKNIIAAVCYNYGVGLHFRPTARAGFLLQMEIKYMDGSMDCIGTDNTWKMIIPGWWKQDSPQMFWTVGFQEIVDLTRYDPESIFGEARLKPGRSIVNNIEPSAFNGDSWDFAVELGTPPVNPWMNLIPRDIPQLMETCVVPDEIADYGECEPIDKDCSLFNVADIMNIEEHTPLKGCDVSFPGRRDSGKSTENIPIRALKGKSTVYIVFDFMKEVVGYPFLEFEAEGCGTMNIGYSECLDSRGRVDPTRQGIRQADTLLFKAGRFEWEMFNRRAFRYMQVTIRGIDKPFVLRKAYIKRVSYPFEKSGYFRSSSEVMNKIYETSKYTLDACMKENYEDCPLREHAQYMGDMRVEALMNYYAFGDTRLIAKGLRQFAREQREDGWFKTLCPGSTLHNIVDYLPLWVTALREYYLFTGDMELLKELYPNMQRLMRWLKSQSNEKGLLAKMPDWWIFIDWADIKKEGIVTGLQCLYYKALIDASWIAKNCGDETGRKLYLVEALKVREATNNLLWDERKGAYTDCSQDNSGFSIQTNCLAVICNIADENKKRRINYFIANGNSKQIITGYFKTYELEALFYLKNRMGFFKGFLYWEEMLKKGAGTWWEIFDAEAGDAIPANSLCHGWSSGPLFHLPSKLLGVLPLKPGFREVLVKPDLFGLEWVEGSIPSVRGDIFVSMKKDGKLMELVCAVPDEVQANVVIPTGTADVSAHCIVDGSCQLLRPTGEKHLHYKIMKQGRYEFRVELHSDGCIEYNSGC